MSGFLCFFRGVGTQMETESNFFVVEKSVVAVKFPSDTADANSLSLTSCLGRHQRSGLSRNGGYGAGVSGIQAG